jgi:hypothetical protein
MADAPTHYVSGDVNGQHAAGEEKDRQRRREAVG